MDLGNPDQALASTLKSLEIDPEASKTWYSLGNIKMAQGKTEEARSDLQKAIKIDPKEYGAYFELSKMLKSGRSKRASQIYRFSKGSESHSKKIDS